MSRSVLLKLLLMIILNGVLFLLPVSISLNVSGVQSAPWSGSIATLLLGLVTGSQTWGIGLVVIGGVQLLFYWIARMIVKLYRSKFH